MQLNEIFKEDKYTEAYIYAIDNNYTIKEIDKDLNGKRLFKIVEIPTPNETEKLQNEIKELKNWFNKYYTEHEQKYRRLNTLKQLTDEQEDPYNKLIELYQEAELKRKRIQEIEVLLNDKLLV